jgi:hypothetical protein
MLLLLTVQLLTTLAVTLKLVLTVPAAAVAAETPNIIAAAAVCAAGEARALCNAG